MEKPQTRRMELHKKLLAIATDFGAKVYFQPPAMNTILKPAIIYSRLAPEVSEADNERYFSVDKYRIEVLYTEPDSELPEAIAEGLGPRCSISNYFVANNIYHAVIDCYQ